MTSSISAIATDGVKGNGGRSQRRIVRNSSSTVVAPDGRLIIGAWFITMAAKYLEVLVRLDDTGNDFRIIGQVSKAMRRVGIAEEEIENFYDEALSGHDHDLLVGHVGAWVAGKPRLASWPSRAMPSTAGARWGRLPAAAAQQAQGSPGAATGPRAGRDRHPTQSTTALSGGSR
jgi:hypothetical protein